MVAAFTWDEKKSECAIALATGKTQKQVAEEVGVPERTQRFWLSHPDFAAEVDRLSLMVDVSSRAERLRIAMRVVREKVKEEAVLTEKDLLDWLKFAQSETDGVKLDLSKLAALGADDTSLADRRQTREAAGGERPTDSRDQGSSEGSGPGME